jgi:hypothetical protein
MTDKRPANCRFRLRDEGKAYPRSGCAACKASIMSGLGNKCHLDAYADAKTAFDNAPARPGSSPAADGGDAG